MTTTWLRSHNWCWEWLSDVTMAPPLGGENVTPKLVVLWIHVTPRNEFREESSPRHGHCDKF